MQRRSHASILRGSGSADVAAMIIESELRAEIARVVANNLPLNELYSWVMERNWNAHKNSAPSAAALSASVEMLFAERLNGDLDDAGVVAGLEALLNEIVVSVTIGTESSQRVDLGIEFQLVYGPEDN